MVEDLNKIVSNYKPFILKNKRLFGPGVYPRVVNGRLTKKIVTKEALKYAFNNTDWKDSKTTDLIQMHEENTRSWIGRVKNQIIDNDGVVFGDLFIYDRDMAIKLGAGKAKFGISPKILEKKGSASSPYLDAHSFGNYSVEYDPADKLTFLNFSDISEEERREIEEDLIIEKKEDDKINTRKISDALSNEEFESFKKSMNDEISSLKEKLEEKEISQEEDKSIEKEELKAAEFAAQRIENAKADLISQKFSSVQYDDFEEDDLTQKMFDRFNKLKLI